MSPSGDPDRVAKLRNSRRKRAYTCANPPRFFTVFSVELFLYFVPTEQTSNCTTIIEPYTTILKFNTAIIVFAPSPHD
jgi:hypothetical protein